VSERAPYAGRLIAFEGVDGAGKSTAIALVADALRERGARVFMPRSGKDHASRPVRAIREITRDRRNIGLDARTELLLYCAREAQVLAELVRPALQRGETVLIDRSLLTAETLGRARGLPVETCSEVAGAAASGLQPDLTIVFDVHPRTARLRKQLARIRSGSDERGGRKGLAGSAFKAAVRAQYHAIALDRGYPVLRCERAEPEQLAARALALIEHGARASTGETTRDATPEWLFDAPLGLHEALERLAVPSALLLGGGLIATRALRERWWRQEPALCAQALDAADPLRETVAELQPAIALRGLAGKPLEGDRDLRVRLMDRAAAACVSALKHVASAQADMLRRRVADEHPNEVLASLAGRNDGRALELRARCAPIADDRSLATALQGCDDPDAVKRRDSLFERDPAYGLRSLKGVRGERQDALLWRYAAWAPAPVLDALSGRADDEAYRLREALAPTGHEVVESVRGLDDERAWAIRERAIASASAAVLHSLTGVAPSARVSALAERCARIGAGDVHVLRRAEGLREQADAPDWVKARRQRAGMEMDE